MCAGNQRAEMMTVRPIPGQVPWGPATISTAEWTGASFTDVLAAAGPGPGAAHVAFTALHVDLVSVVLNPLEHGSVVADLVNGGSGTSATGDAARENREKMQVLRV